MAEFTTFVPFDEPSSHLQSRQQDGVTAGMKIGRSSANHYSLSFRAASSEGVYFTTYPANYHSLRTILTILRELSFYESDKEYRISFQSVDTFKTGPEEHRPKLTIIADGKGQITLICNNDRYSSNELVENKVTVNVRPMFVHRTIIEESQPLMRCELIAGWADSNIATLDYIHHHHFDAEAVNLR